MGLFSFTNNSSRDARREIQGVGIPTMEASRLQLEELVQQGIITPAQFQTILQEQSGYNLIEEDPGLRANQLGAIEGFRDIADNQGMDAQFRAALNDAIQQSQTANRGAQEAIMANARARGQAGSNLEFTNRLIAQQQGSQTAANQAVNSAAQAEARRAGALEALSGLSSQVRGQDYSVASNRAAAQDAINRFNAQNTQQQANLNTQATNAAQAVNLGEKQRVSDQNVGIRNQQQITNKLTTPQNLAQMRLGQATAASNQAQAEDRQDTQNRDQALGAISTFAMMMSDEREKEKVRPFDSREVLEELSGVKYRYSDPTLDRGQDEAGIMAQDLERVAPAAVQEDGQGRKQVDMGRVGGLILASLADINDRLSSMEDTGRAGRS